MYEDEKFSTLPRVYFYGMIATALEYNVVLIDEADKEEIQEILALGIGYVKVRNIDGHEFDCIAFFWRSKSGLNRGLVIHTRDFKSIKYAVECKSEQRDYLV